MIVIAILAGLALGHVLDLFRERFYSGSALLAPPVRCQACEAPAGALYLLPFVGYLSHAGLCPSCHAALPVRALILPFGAAALFALGYAAQGEQLGAGLLAGAFCTLFLALVFTDLDQRLIPNRITYPAIVAAAALAWGWTDRGTGSVLAGGAAALGISLVLYLLARGGFGLGDVKMLTLMGLTSGFPYFLVGLFITALVGGVVSAALVLTRVRRMKEAIPYGPFIAAGAIVSTLWGPAIWDWYRG